MEWEVHVSWVATRYVNKCTLKFYLGIKDLFLFSLSDDFLNCRCKELILNVAQIQNFASCMTEALNQIFDS